MTPEHALNNEPTIIPPDREDNPETDPQETNPDTSPENQPDLQESIHEIDPNPEPSSPRKGKYNLRSNPPSNWKKDYAYYNPLNVETTL